MMRSPAAAAAVLVALLAAAACSSPHRPMVTDYSPLRHVEDAERQSVRDLERDQHERLEWPDDRERFTEAARVAWNYLQRHTQPATGFMVGAYPFATIWDVGSMVAALYSAHALHLVDDHDYRSRMLALLATLQRLTLYENHSFNKAYEAHTGAATTPHGVSVIDLGRLLVWLKIVGVDPAFAPQVDAVVRRTDFTRLVHGGYLWGETETKSGDKQEYQEGTLGYEQYAAQGFALWGHHAERALNLDQNALPITVNGQALVADYRRFDRLTPEPFLLWGLELGLSSEAAGLARRMLYAQEARYRQTGRLTVVGEDAIDQPPYWFYYYCVYANGQDFAIDTQSRFAFVDSPRWVSAKAAFAFHALMPTPYTDLAMQAVTKGARSASGAWASGMFEDTNASTRSDSLNTAAVILTAALYDRHGVPIIEQAAQP